MVYTEVIVNMLPWLARKLAFNQSQVASDFTSAICNAAKSLSMNVPTKKAFNLKKSQKNKTNKRFHICDNSIFAELTGYIIIKYIVSCHTSLPEVNLEPTCSILRSLGKWWLRAHVPVSSLILKKKTTKQN